MRLVMLGTGGFIPTETAQTACYLLPEVGVMLDAGTGLYRTSRYLPEDSELDVFLSHAHGDHTEGLTWLFASFMLQELRMPGVDETAISGILDRSNARLHSVRVHATQSTVDALRAKFEAFHLDWRLLTSPEALPQGGRITHFSASQGDEVGFRLDWPGHSLAYVTDTTAGPDVKYIENIRGVDLLLHDCNGPDRMAGLMARISHSTPSAAALVAARAGVKRLVLIHHNPMNWSIEEDLGSARRIFANTEIGTDGMELEF
ncbi:MAG: MBL fold metallo-hydrolase [Anaerolineaceae bacterium]|nr:MBL fold metallo-hydrolase [Anaerolineaceae bacterium]